MVALLERRDAARLLRATPEPFSPATFEKRRALSHFQPHGVLISEGDERARLRALNEATLEGVADGWAEEVAGPAAERHVQALTARGAAGRREVDWDDFRSAWWSTVLEVVFGPAASDDQGLISDLERLRSAANWAYLWPRRKHLRTAVLEAIGDRRRTTPATALTPLILREQLDETFAWGSGATTAGTSLAIFTPYFHRDVPEADEFQPGRWNGDNARLDDDATLVPFSAGPAI